MLTPILLILALALVHIARVNTILSPYLWQWTPAIAAPVLVLIIFILARRRQRMSARRAHFIDRGSHIAALIIFGLWVLSSSWSHVSPFTILIISPLLFFQYLLWILVARVLGAMNRQQALAMANIRLRFETLPIVILVVLLDLMNIVLSDDIFAAAGEWAMYAEIISSIIGMFVILSILPIVLLRLWGCTSVKGSDIEHVLNTTCSDAQTPVHYMYQWPQRAYPFYNAMAMGLLPRWRVVIISADLAQILKEDQLRAVIGHELGHLKHKHLPIYLSFMITLSIWSGLIAIWLYPWYRHLFPGDMSPNSVIAIVDVALLILGLRYLFGYLSRACERQADIHGAHLAGSEAMCSALLAVAHAVGQDPEHPNWRHYSIGQRIRFLQNNEHSVRQPRIYARRIMKLRTFILIALLIALTFSMIQHTRSISLTELRNDSPQLTQAINSAAAGDEAPLFHWLAQRSDFDRSFYLKAIKAELKHEDDPDGAVPDSELPQRLYKKKHLFTPFVNLSIGNSSTDLELDNLIGYSLVAGTRDPQPSDIAYAKIILTRLEARMLETPVAGIFDTIGCIHFIIGDYQKSVTAFENALSELKETKDSDSKTEQNKIYRKRLKAAQDQEKDLPLEWKTS